MSAIFLPNMVYISHTKTGVPDIVENVPEKIRCNFVRIGEVGDQNNALDNGKTLQKIKVLVVVGVLWCGDMSKLIHEQPKDCLFGTKISLLVEHSSHRPQAKTKRNHVIP